MRTSLGGKRASLLLEVFLVFRALVTALALAGIPILSGGQGPPKSLIGTWQVVSRLDHDSAGHELVEPTLGTHPLGYLIYDAAGHVAAQLMGPDRTPESCKGTGETDTNNSTYLCAYDAYFGRYAVDTVAGTVTHYVDGALVPQDVGRQLVRHFRLKGDTLIITLQVHRPDGAQATRTILWHRVSP